MPREREKMSKKIKTVDYDIDDNSIRAWYNAAGELLFVLDETINKDKPNVLLVIDSFDERKWDDVLANDYGIDLETVRPKRDNKYQKLDIEYGGLDVYSELIDAYESGEDLEEPLENLNRFRIMSVRRSAKERLAAADDVANKARETIERTNDTISELRARIKELRAKLSEQKRNVGREPTKVSAAKILKTESQIDATNEKLERAKKRLESAKRRLANAEDDAEIARAILARHADIKPVRRAAAAKHAPKRAPVVTTPVVDDDEEDSDEKYDEEYNDSETYDVGTEEVDDTENNVKPLFDKDPEILDENIAFKPIDFNTNDSVARSAPAEPVVAPVPLSFTPPTDDTDSGRITVEENTIENETPVLDNLTSVDAPVVDEKVELETNIEPTPFDQESVTDVESETVTEITPVEPVATVEAIEPIEPVAPIAPVRPVSPITGYNAAAGDEQRAKRPTLLYYIMLILLIALSIFTLWLYQKKNGAVVPDLAVTSGETEKVADTATGKNAETNIPSPFIATTTERTEKVETKSDTKVVKEAETAVDTVTAAEPVVEPTEPEPEPVAVAVSETVAVVEPEPEPVAVVAKSKDVTVESPFVELRTVATYEPEKKPIPTEEEVLARKPGYNVSQNEKMFVAAPQYDTEKKIESDDESFVDATYSMDVDVQPIPVVENVPEIVASEVVDTTPAVVDETESGGCANGAPADGNGCCPGEEYSYTDDGFMCCADDGCFPPLQ